MQLSTAFHYQIRTKLKVGGIFYSIIYAILLLPVVISLLYGSHGAAASGIEISSVVFLMVMSISTYKEDMRMFLQNATSRKTMIASVGLNCMAAALGMSIIDLFNQFLFGHLYTYETMFSQMYEFITIPSNGALFTLYSFLWSSMACFCFAMLGFFIGALFNRLSKMWRLLVMFGVPIAVIFLLPFLDITLFDGVITASIGRAIMFMLGFQNGVNPLYAVVSFLGVGLLLYLFGALITRRAAVSD